MVGFVEDSRIPTKFRLRFCITHYISLLDLEYWENLVFVQPRRESKLRVNINLGKILSFMEWVLSTHLSLMLILNNLWFLDARIRKLKVVIGLSVAVKASLLSSWKDLK